MDIHYVLYWKKKTPIRFQNIEPYFQELQFMNLQLKYLVLPCKRLAENTCIRWGYSKHTVEQIICGENSWIKTRSIVSSLHGKHAKSQSMLNDKGTPIAVCKYIDSAGESMYC